MNIASPEYEFVSKFLTLATLTQPALPKHYRRPLQEVNNLGVALPALKHRYHAKSSNDHHNGHGLKLILKSVRPPKFVLEHDFNWTDTVRDAKKYLISEGKAKQLLQVRLLFKGKVLHDHDILSDFLSNHSSIVVMISKCENTPQKDPVAAESPLQIPWEAIGRALSEELKDPHEVEMALLRLKRGWDLTN